MEWFIEFWNSDALWEFYKTILQILPYLVIMGLAGGLSFRFGKTKGKKSKDDEVIQQLNETIKKLNKTIESLNEEIEKLKSSQRSQLRDIITKQWQTCMKRKKRYVTPEEKDLMKSCYREYERLKGNTYIEHMYQDIITLEEYSPQNLKLPKEAQKWREEHADELEE